MDGWLGAIGSIFEWAAGSGIVGSLVRVAAAFGLMKFVSGLNKTQTTQTVPDNRIQIAPATDNKIPIAYGASYFNGTIFDIELTNSNKSMYAAIALCETTGNLFSTGGASQIYIDAVYLDNKLITFQGDGTTIDHTTDDTGVVDYQSQGLVGVYLYQGNSSSPMLPVQPGTTTAISGTVPPAAYSIMPGWNNTYMAENLIFAIVKLNYDQSKGQHTIPNLKFHVVNSISLPGDVLYDYMTNDLYGAGIDPSLINSSSITALNTYSAQTITYGAYPSQQRYAVNGLIATSNKVLDNMDKIAATAGSYITYDVASGKWSVIIQQVISQTYTFNDHNIIGQVNATGTALDQYYNAVEVQFPYSYYRDQNNYIRIDLPSQDLDYNEPINVLKLQHDLINNQVQAALIGNIMLRQAREDLVVEFKTDFSSYNLQIGDVFGLTNSTYGFTNRQFRVIKLIKNEDDKGELTIAVTGLSYNPDVYTVDTIDQFYPLLGTSTNPNLGAIGTPIAPTVAYSTISSQPSITITATIPSGVVTDMEFWGSSDGTNYTWLGSTRSINSGPFTTGTTTSYKTVLLQTATWYFKVRGGNLQGTGQFSPASSGIDYTYIQAPDVLPYNTPITNPNSSTQALQGLGLGILAAWAANQLLGLATSELGSLFGLTGDQTSAIDANAAKQFTGGITTTTGSGLTITNGSIALDPTAIAALTAAPCYLGFGTKYPADRSVHENPELNTSGDRAATTGNYNITVTDTTKTLIPGTGKIYLYKSDGTLVQTIAASAITINGYQLLIPFSNRTIGTDYYILMDKNVVTDGTCQSAAISDPYSWNFHTANPPDQPIVYIPPVNVQVCPPLKFVKVITYLTSTYVNATNTGKQVISPDNTKVDTESNIGLQFNQSIIFGTSGTITIKSGSLGLTYQTFNITYTFAGNKIGDLFWIEGDTLWLNSTVDFTPGATMYVNITANCVYNSCNSSGNTAITDTTTAHWTVDGGATISQTTAPPSGQSINQAGISLGLDRPAAINPSGTIDIKDSSGNIVKTIYGSDPAISTKEG